LSQSSGYQDKRLPKHEVAELYRRTGVLVLRRCLLILTEKAEAEDVLQEVFIRLMRYGTFSKADQVPLAWLYRTAERCCFDRLRKLKREPAGIPEDLLLTTPGGGAQHEAAELVLRFFHKMDDKLRQVALMHYLDGLPQEQIAAQTGWSRRTVGKKIKKLRQRAQRLAHSQKEDSRVSPSTL
jgi:RNA polymerase sigma-70 factor, ECF subfamily